MHDTLKTMTLAVSLTVLAGCTIDTYSTHVITGSPHEAIAAEQVKLYTDPPAHYEVIGLINARAEEGFMDEEQEQTLVDAAITQLKDEAAKLGANGIIIEGVLNNTTSDGGLLWGGKDVSAYSATSSQDKSVHGKAIYVLP